MKQLAQEDRYMSFDEFSNQLQDVTCTEWNKQNPHGESYADFYSMPKGHYQEVHAWDLTYARNRSCLWRLPYPRAMVIKMVKFACRLRMDCVAHVDSLCMVVMKKMASLDRFQHRLDNLPLV
jgi:hypothetical protein